MLMLIILPVRLWPVSGGGEHFSRPRCCGWRDTEMPHGTPLGPLSPGKGGLHAL